MQFEINKPLKDFNTFHIDAQAEKFICVDNEKSLLEVLTFAKQSNTSTHFIGGGSNILLTKNIEGITILNQIKGIHIIEENEEFVLVNFSSGENWHECVLWAVSKNYGGIENLSLIPGTIGASPIQNIGAYGVELKDVFHSLEAINLTSFEKKIFTLEECNFGYRDSIFKQHEKGNWFILNVRLHLTKNPICNIHYGNIKDELLKMKVENPCIQDVSKAVINIRSSKLPNPDEIGNAGSFFKNPIVSLSHFEALKSLYPEIPHFMTTNGVKIPAAWLIEKNNWKGFKEGDLGVHKNQALVLVNYKHAKGKDILELSSHIITSVQQTFNITLEREVNIW
jgi:UDP-N-acetylmuramate dehydrogenase